MGYQTAPHGSLGLPCGLYQFMSLTEGTTPSIVSGDNTAASTQVLATIPLDLAKLTVRSLPCATAIKEGAIASKPSRDGAYKAASSANMDYDTLEGNRRDLDV